MNRKKLLHPVVMESSTDCYRKSHHATAPADLGAVLGVDARVIFRAAMAKVACTWP
jgi:hypothetical protein